MTADAPQAATLRRLRRRSQFLRAARGNRAGRSAFGLQVMAAEDELPGIGYTVTKKVGNSPERNRMKRRLRAAAAACADDFKPGHDYVLLARREALYRPFAKMINDLSGLIARVHDADADGNRIRPGRGQRNSTP
ncbi:MAG: ribonuclease P protein component [Hyphomicrobiales bacterium]|nr:MAG: ribonuclease P protein component [Hyphomicrobiales bacterium]